MNHKMIVGLFLFATLCVVSSTEEISYHGLRIDISASTLNRDILASVLPAMNRTLKNDFRSLSDHGDFISLYIADIKITKPEIKEKLFKIKELHYSAPIYELRGEPGCISFDLSFKFSATFLGLTIASGKGTGLVINKAEKIYVFFNESHPDVQIPHPWDVDKISLSRGIYSPKEWVEELLERKFIQDFHEAVDDAMFDFAHNLLKTYEVVEDIFGEEFDLIYYNTLTEIKSTVNETYMSFGFSTNITVNREKIRKMYRKTNSAINPLGDFSLCFAAELLPDSLDVLGKAGYHRLDWDPEQWGFDNNTVSSLFHLLPELRNVYDPSKVFVINCEVSASETINDLGQRGMSEPFLKLQYPMLCVFSVKVKDDVKEDVLTLNIYARFDYTMNSTDQAYNGYITTTELRGFTSYPELPIVKRETLKMYINNFVKKFEYIPLIAPGIRVIPNRHEQLRFVSAKESYDEICFGYNEKEDY